MAQGGTGCERRPHFGDNFALFQCGGARLLGTPAQFFGCCSRNLGSYAQLFGLSPIGLGLFATCFGVAPLTLRQLALLLRRYPIPFIASGHLLIDDALFPGLLVTATTLGSRWPDFLSLHNAIRAKPQSS